MEPRDVHLLFVGASIALSLAIAVQAWRESRWSRATRGLIVALVACGAFYSLLPAPLGAEWPRSLRVFWRVLAAPGVLLAWLTLRTLFGDAGPLRPRHLAPAVALAGVAALAWLDGESTGAWSRFAAVVLGAVALALALQLLWALVTGRSADLDATRRASRLLLAGAGAMLVLLALAGAVWQLPERWSGFGSAQLGVQILVKLGWLWLMAAPASPVAAWLAPPPPLPAPAAHGPPAALLSPEARQARELLDAMHQRQLHRRTGLTIVQLAEELKLPEYRLRQCINQQLGFRNFNAFLNRFRLDEVAARLADPAQAEVAITTIALEAGYASLGPFNRAFRDAFGVTPSEYRRQPTRAAPADS